MSSKRGAERELNYNNWNEEEESEEAEDYRKASIEELQTSVRKVAKMMNAEEGKLNSFSAAGGFNATTSSGITVSTPVNQSQMGFQTSQYGQYDQDGNKFRQQNYSCFTPTVNSVNSYMSSGDVQSTVTQSSSYSQTGMTDKLQAQKVAQSSVTDSPHRQPHSIPTNTPAMASMTTNNFDTHSTHSSQDNKQISSSNEQKLSNPAPTSSVPEEIKPIDFSMSSPSVNNKPILTPVSVTKKEIVMESPLKVEPVTSTVTTAPIKLNEDLADLPISKVLKPTENPKKLEDSFENSTTLKQFHKEVENAEKLNAAAETEEEVEDPL